MSTTLLTILIAVGAVAFFAAALSLTLIFKGHNIKSEISENENMQRLGIKCAMQQMREEEGLCAAPGPECHSGDCSGCSGHAKK